MLSFPLLRWLRLLLFFFLLRLERLLGFAQAGVHDGRLDMVGLRMLAHPVLRGAKALGRASQVLPGQLRLPFGAQSVQGLPALAPGGGQQLPGRAVIGVQADPALQPFGGLLRLAAGRFGLRQKKLLGLRRLRARALAAGF